jgi:Sigma-70, region 4
MTNQHSRNTEMSALYAAGETLEQIGGRYNVTRERVRQILKQTGGTSVADARERRREIRSDLLDEAVTDFLGEFGETVRQLAERGCSRSEVEERFKVLIPSVSSTVVRDSIDSLGVLFNVDVQELNFSDTVVAEALWFTVGRDMHLEPAPLAALADPQFEDSRELSKALRSEGLTAEQSPMSFPSELLPKPPQRRDR